MKESNDTRTIVSFIWVPTAVGDIRKEIIEAREAFQDIEESLDEARQDIEENILFSTVSGKKIKVRDILDKSFVKEVHKKALKLKRKGLPPISSHELIDQNDAIVKMLADCGLENKEEDRVKVVFYPIYLSGSDGLINLNYYESIQASHLGVFPSFYEPWGYTPLESAALGIAAATTDLTGFGMFFEKKFKKGKYPGIFMLERMNREDKDIIFDLTDIMHRFSRFTHDKRVKNKYRAREIAAMADWKILVKYYLEAHNRALIK